MNRGLTIAVAFAAFLSARTADASCEDKAAAVTSRDPSLDPPSEPTAAAHMTKGNGLMRGAQYEEAEKEYAAGMLVESVPVFLYNLGQVFRLAEDYKTSIRQYRLFLDRGKPGQALRELVECHIAMMQAELDKAAATEPPTGPAPDIGESVDRPTVPRWYSDGVGWGLAGGGVVVGAAGVYLLLDAGRLDDEALREDRQDVREQLRDKADTRRLWGTIAGGVGAAVLVAGIVKLVITPDALASDGADLSWFVGPGGTLGLAGAF